MGAVLVIDDQVAALGRNSAESSKSYVNHAETSLIIENGEKLLETWKNNRTATLYSTLEPCLMCLGVAVMNKVGRIVYIEKDPLAGACGIDKKSLGERYHRVWPIIEQIRVSEKSKQMIVEFLRRQIGLGVRVEWSKDFLKLLNEDI